MARELIQTRADGDTVDTLEEYVDDTDLSRSEVIRRAVRRYLAEEGYAVAAADGAGIVSNELEELRGELGELEATIEEQQAEQQRANRVYMASIVSALAYFVASFTTNASGPLWTGAGVGVIVAVVAATYYYNRVSGDE